MLYEVNPQSQLKQLSSYRTTVKSGTLRFLFSFCTFKLYSSFFRNVSLYSYDSGASQTKIQKKYFKIQEKNTPSVLWACVLWACDAKHLKVVNNALKLKQKQCDTYVAIFEEGTGTKAQFLWHSFRSPSLVVMYCKKNIYIFKYKIIYISYRYHICTVIYMKYYLLFSLMSAVRILTVFLFSSRIDQTSLIIII